LSKLRFMKRGKGVLSAFLCAAIAVLGLAAAPFLSAGAGATTGTISDPNATFSYDVSPTTGISAGTVITGTFTRTSGTATLASVNARICKPGTGALLFGGDTFDYGFQGEQCVRGAFPGGAGYGATPTPLAPGTTSTAPTFTAGVGTVNWTTDAPDNLPETLTCDDTHPCELVYELGLAGGSNPTIYYAQTLTFAGTPATPGAPANPIAASNADGTSHVTWGAAPANNSVIDQYIVTATRTGGATDGASPRTLQVGNVLSGDIPLNNFSVYDISVQAHTSSAVVPQTGPSSSVVHNVTPLPAGPTNVNGLPSDQSMDLTWTAPAFTSGLGSYEVTATGGPSPIVQCSDSTTPAYHFTGLTNGTPYTFSVRASYSAACAGPFGLSGTSGSLAPAGAQILQQITVDRPQGALVLTQACDATQASPYPVDANGVPNPVYPTTQAVYQGSCAVNLGHATFVTTDQPATATLPAIGEGQFFTATGAIKQVSIVDTRDSDVGWTVSGSLTDDFRSGSKHFSAHQLGWDPILTDHSQPFSTPDQNYAQVVNEGPIAKPAGVQGVGPAPLSGLGLSRTLASSPTPTGPGLGIAHLDAQLNLLIPVFAKSGVYTSILQITAV
jgi:hypothetical protein